MRWKLTFLCVAAAGAFVAASLGGFDWRTLFGTSGAVFNDAARGLRAAAGMEAGPERVAVAPGAKAPGGPAAADPAAAAKAAANAPVVTVSKPIVKEIIEWDEYTARFDAVESVEVRARVSGYLNEVKFKDGEDVKQGDLLYQIDPRPFETTVAQAQAELEAARTKAANAKLDVDRGGPLVDRKVMSQKVYDDRESALREAQAAIKVAEAKLNSAQLDLSFTRMLAPLSGRISRSLVTPGNYVNGGTTNISTLLTTIVTQSPIFIYFDVSENNYLKYKRLIEQGQQAGASSLGSPVYIALPDEEGFRHVARLDFIDNRLDQATATIRVRARLDNASGLFSPGMFARVRIAGTPRYSGTLLPDECILSDQASKYVYVVGEDGVAQRKSVTLGPLVDKLRVVRSGVAAGDWVVIRGLQRTRPGVKVTPRPEPIKVSEADGLQPAPNRR